MDRRGFLITLVAAAPAFAPRDSWAQAAPMVRIRGKIAAVAGNSLTVTTRDGQTVEIGLTEPLVVMAVEKAELSDIGPNTYVGSTTRTGADGKMTAIEIRIFPENMRGAGEGSRDWDLEPGSKMTNGTVTGAVSAASGRDVTVGYKAGASTIHVAPNAGIMRYVPGAKADLKPGEVLFVNAARAADGKLTTNRVNVSRNGVAPMM